MLTNLIEAALAARQKAHAPYSRFQVGAALQHRDGRLFTGSNIENASYGLTVCAERVAIWKAVSEGARRGEFLNLVVAADTDDLTPPCGACRQVLSEFCDGSFEITLVNPAGKRITHTLGELLPYPFSQDFLR